LLPILCQIRTKRLGKCLFDLSNHSYDHFCDQIAALSQNLHFLRLKVLTLAPRSERDGRDRRRSRPAAGRPGRAHSGAADGQAGAGFWPSESGGTA
jgi:hypothetical protein